MGTIWAAGSGRVGSCWSGRAWQPLPRPALAQRPPAPQVSQAARGGGEAWLGFRAGQAASLSGPWFLQAPSQMLGRWRSAGLTRSWPPHHPHREATRQASPPPSHSPQRPSCSAPQALGHAGLWAFALAVPPSLPHSRKSLRGSLASFRPHPKSYLLGASLPPHSSVWGALLPTPLHTLPLLCFPAVVLIH